MNPAPGSAPRQTNPPRPAAKTIRLGCVSFLNAKPLIDGIEDGSTAASGGRMIRVRYDVPARLLDDLEAGEADLALCPVIDYHRSRLPLRVVPVGGIGCEGPTLTVRLYSRVPIDRITTIHADTDSHTSVALLRVLLDALYNLRPTLIDYHAQRPSLRSAATKGGISADHPESLLLIGDKVVTDSPAAVMYPHQLDLGEAWHGLTGLPFVFAIWMAPLEADLADAPVQLAQQLEHNLASIDAIVERYADRHGWPADLARQYLGDTLRYRIGERELQAIERFSQMAHRLDLIDQPRPLQRWSPAP